MKEMQEKQTCGDGSSLPGGLLLDEGRVFGAARGADEAPGAD